MIMGTRRWNKECNKFNHFALFWVKGATLVTTVLGSQMLICFSHFRVRGHCEKNGLNHPQMTLPTMRSMVPTYLTPVPLSPKFRSVSLYNYRFPRRMQFFIFPLSPQCWIWICFFQFHFFLNLNFKISRRDFCVDSQLGKSYKKFGWKKKN